MSAFRPRWAVIGTVLLSIPKVRELNYQDMMKSCSNSREIFEHDFGGVGSKASSPLKTRSQEQ